MKWYKKLYSIEPYPDAILHLASFYKMGKGCEVNTRKANFLYQEAFNEGLKNSQLAVELAKCYKNGKCGLEKNITAAPIATRAQGFNPNGKSGDFAYDSNGNLTQDYVGGIEYKEQKMEAIYNDEGRLLAVDLDNNGTRDLFRFEWVLEDHLGSTRVLFRPILQCPKPNRASNYSTKSSLSLRWRNGRQMAANTSHCQSRL